MQTHYIKLGVDRKGNDVFYITYGRYGVTIIEATARVGKSQICRNIYAHQAVYLHRPTIIFCYEGEHKWSKFANTYKQGYAFGISHLKTYENVVFKIHEFNQQTDWESLNFPPGASRVLSDLARMAVCENCKKVWKQDDECPNCHKIIKNPETIHHDDFNVFYEIIKWYPTEYAQKFSYDRFEKDFGFRPDSGINSKSKFAIMDRLQSYAYIFWKDPQKHPNVEQTWVENWGEELKHVKCIHINFAMKTEDRRQVTRSRAIAGKILYQLSCFAKHYKNTTYLELLHPLLIFEEADRIFPFLPNEEIMPTSVAKLNEFVTKKQRYGCELIFVTQNVNMLNQTAMQNWHTIIAGVGGSAMPDIAKYLRWDIDLGIREFLFARKGKWETQIFNPDIVPAMLPPDS